MTGVSVTPLRDWIRCYAVAAGLGHGIGCLVVRAWVTRRRHGEELDETFLGTE